MKRLRHIFVMIAVLSLIAANAAAATDSYFNEHGWMKENALKFPEIPVEVSPSEGILILSDSPEMVYDDGIMYQDTVQGNIRLFFHHVNATNAPKKILALLVNEGKEDSKIDIINSGVAGPGGDYLEIGKRALEEYFHPKYKNSFTISAGRTAFLDVNLNFMSVAPNFLVNGIYEFVASKPVRVIVMMMPTYLDATIYYKYTKMLPADKERLRGTFTGKDRLVVPKSNYVADKKNGPSVITLADNKIDKFSYGVDATDGSQTQNYGNYGVMYRLYIPSRLGGKFSLFLNPRGGTYAGSVTVEYQRKGEQTIKTPADRIYFGENTSNDFAHLGDFEGGHSLWLTFSPPGASNLPVKLILVPR